ncbi:MAG TPA: potassium/proton antiporter [Thermoanaerobaculia bacterium]
MPDLTAGMLIAAGLLAASVLASKAASRFGVPALLLFLAIGMAAGSEGVGGITFVDAGLTQSIGIIALAFILFSGGLDTKWSDVRPVLGAGISLATIAILVSAFVIGLAAHLLLDFPLIGGVLLGAIVSSTDAAAVFSVLRSRGVNLGGQVRPLIELESGSNDPMAVFLTIALIERFVNPEAPLSGFALSFVLQMTVGAIVGILAGKIAVWLLNAIRLEYDGLYPVLTLAIVLATYAAATGLRGNGFLAVYVAGIVAGNERFIHRRSVMRFHDGIAWLMQIAMFLALGLLVFPSELASVAGLGLTIALVATFVARPLSVFIALAFSRFDWREKLFISWAGLRGAVPIILATFAMTAQLRGSITVFNIVFFSVIISVLMQGATIPLAARVLRVTAVAPQHDPALHRRLESDLLAIDLAAGSPAIGRQLVELSLPVETLVLLVYREDSFFAPTGSTLLEADDRLMVFTDKVSVDEVREILQGTSKAL